MPVGALKAGSRMFGQKMLGFQVPQMRYRIGTRTKSLEPVFKNEEISTPTYSLVFTFHPLIFEEHKKSKKRGIMSLSLKNI